MGKEKYQVQIENLFNKSPVVDFKSIERLINSEKRVKQYSKQVIRNLLLKGKIKKISKGYYSLYDDPALNVFCFQPSYFGLQDALSFHGIWEQETIPIILTSRKARQGLKKTALGNILIRRINSKYFFGIEYVEQGGFYLPYSDLEKTFIDFIYFKEKMNLDILNTLKKKIDKTKLNNYLKKYPENFRKKVIKMYNK